MFDIGGFELLLIAVVGLLVIGPERLPETLRTLGLWLGRLRRSFTAVKTEIEKEIGMDEVKRQLHNEAVMEEMQRIEREVKGTAEEARIDPNLPAQTADHTTTEEEEVTTQTILPPSEAEVEAAYQRKMRAQQSGAEDQP